MRRMVKRFLLLWLFMFATFLVARLSVNMLVYGWIDLRKSALAELLVLPLAQALLFLPLSGLGRRSRKP